MKDHTGPKPDERETVLVPPIGAGGILLPDLPRPRKSSEEVKRLIEMYPEHSRRWCSAPEEGGCACLGCVRWPAPSTVRGDPEGKPFPNPDDRLSREEVEAYQASLRS